MAVVNPGGRRNRLRRCIARVGAVLRESWSFAASDTGVRTVLSQLR